MRAVTFRTERLQLRSATAADIDAFHRILGDPKAMTYWSSVPHRSVAETEAWVRAMIAIPPGEGEDFVVEHQGEVIGKAGLTRFPQIGFILHPDHWGKGFAAEALRFVIDRAFRVHRLERIEADVDPRN
jgi:RimJ/RimL family protein N-acetyltransferase